MPFTIENNPKRKLTHTQVHEIKQLIKKGIPIKDIAEHFQVTPPTISRIKRGKAWKSKLF